MNQIKFYIFGTLLFLLLANLLHSRIDISLNHDNCNKNKMPYGSCGISDVNIENDKVKKNVYLMGNSVFQNFTGPEICKQSQNTNFKIHNFALRGSSIFDYIFTYNKIKDQKPDLLIVQLSPVTFTSDWPAYKLDAHKTLFQPSNLSLLKNKKIIRHYSKDEFTESILFSYLPSLRFQSIDKYRLTKYLSQTTPDIDKKDVWSFFSQSLNMPIGQAIKRDKTKHNPVEYEAAKEMLILFLNQLKESNQKTVLVIQPSRYKPIKVIHNVISICEEYDNISVKNHKYFYKIKEYKDMIHPKEKALKADARRHVRIIKEILSDDI